jgi:hypothetical protein
MMMYRLWLSNLVGCGCIDHTRRPAPSPDPHGDDDPMCPLHPGVLCVARALRNGLCVLRLRHRQRTHTAARADGEPMSEARGRGGGPVLDCDYYYGPTVCTRRFEPRWTAPPAGKAWHYGLDWRDVRARARAQGWATLETATGVRLDLCPAHAPAELAAHKGQ